MNESCNVQSFREMAPLLFAGMCAFIARRNRAPVPKYVEEILSANEGYFKDRIQERKNR